LGWRVDFGEEEEELLLGGGTGSFLPPDSLSDGVRALVGTWGTEW